MRNFWRFGILITFVLGLTACGATTPPANPTSLPTIAALPTEAPTATAAPLPTKAVSGVVESSSSQPPGLVRFVNAAPDTTPLNIYVGIQAIATNLGFSQFTEPTPVGAGDYTFKVSPSGSTSSDTPLLETQLTIKSQDSLVVLISGDENQLAMSALPDQIDPLNKGESIVHVIHAVTGSGAVGLRDGSNDVISPVNFGQSATTAILPAASTTLEFTSDGKKLIDFNADLQERTNYTLILAGHIESPSVISFKASAPGRSTVRAINASPQINSIDLYLDKTLLLSGVDYGRQTDRQNVISGQHTMDIYEKGADHNTIQPLVSQPVSFDSDKNIALVFLGAADQFTIVSYEEDTSPTPPGEERVAFLNTLPNLPSVHIETSGGEMPGVSDLIYGDPPPSILLDTGTYSFYSTAVDQNGVNNTVENAPNLQFEPGINYLYMITGRLDNNPIILSENVGIDSKLADVPDTNGTPQAAEQAAQVRFVNALQDQSTIDFLVNNEVSLTGLAAQQGSDLTTVTDLTPTIQVSLSGSSDILAQADATLEAGSRYTAIAYGADKTDIHVLILPDSHLVFDGASPHIRLINISPESDTQLGFGFADSSLSPTIATPVITGERPFVPNGIQQSVNAIGGGQASNVILMPVGTFNFYIIDSNAHEIAATITQMALEAGAHYDVIGYQNSDATQSQAFVLTYPVRSN